MSECFKMEVVASGSETWRGLCKRRWRNRQWLLATKRLLLTIASVEW